MRCAEIVRLESGGDGGYALTLRGGGTVAVSERYVAALKLALQAGQRP